MQRHDYHKCSDQSFSHHYQGKLILLSIFTASQGIFSLCVGTLIKMKKWAVNSLRMDLKGIEREAA